MRKIGSIVARLRPLLVDLVQIFLALAVAAGIGLIAYGPRKAAIFLAASTLLMVVVEAWIYRCLLKEVYYFWRKASEGSESSKG